MNKMALGFVPRFLTAGQLPFPPQCNGPNGVFNIDCADQMYRTCSRAAPSNNRIYSSELLNPQSNCNTWRIMYENAYDAFPEQMQQLIAKLDDAEKLFCSKYPSTNECRCIRFPTVNKKQCDAQYALNGCSGKPEECLGKEFVREADAISDSTFINISFDKCMPYWCWADVCWPENGAGLQLQPTYVRDGQRQCTENICINIIEQNTISGVLEPAASSANYAPSTTRITLCNANAPATPIYFPNQYQVPINVVSTYPFVFYITNPGNTAATLQLETITGGDNFLDTTGLQVLNAYPNNVTKFQFTVNGELLTSLFNIRSAGQTESVAVLKDPVTTKDIPSPVLNYSYVVGGTETQFLQIYLDLVLLPAVSNLPLQPLVAKETPTWSYITLGVAAAIFLAAFLAWNISNSNGLQFAKQYKLPQQVASTIVQN